MDPPWVPPVAARIREIPADATLVSWAGPDGDSFTVVQLHVDGDGDFHLGFHVAIDGTLRSLPEVEDFARRVRAFIDAEPVLPDAPEPL